MKTTVIITLSSLLICTIIFAQNSKSLEAKSVSNSNIESVKKTNVSSPVNDEAKTQLLGTWKFHEITIRTPKDGYLIHIAQQEVGLINLFIVNYTFNKTQFFAVKIFSSEGNGTIQENVYFSKGTYQESKMFLAFQKQHLNLL